MRVRDLTESVKRSTFGARRRQLLVLPVVALALVATACGSSTSQGGAGGTSGQTGAAPEIQPPSAIASAGQIVFCSDITYPPEEFYEGSKPVGSDIDIGTEIARLMGVKAQFDNTGFDGIIPALLSNKCDAIISGMNDTSERRKQVDFVDYLDVGQSLMVKAGNPENIASLTDLSGKAVSVEVGTTNKDFLDQESKKLQGESKAAIQVTTFPKDTDAANALKQGKVDAYFGDSPVVAYYIAQDPSSFGFGGQPVNPIPVGIALRKDETDLTAAVQQAVTTMYSSGTMAKILAQWKMSDFAMKQ